MISASSTTLNVTKTKLMTQVLGDGVNKVAATLSGVSTIVKLIIMDEGWIGFTRGMGPRVVHSTGFCAIRYFCF